MNSSKKVGIIGAGVIGLSWADLFMEHGWEVKIFDTHPENIPDSSHYTLVDTIEEAVKDADHVQENCPERVEIKHSIFQEIAASAPRHAVLASSSSSLLPSAITAGVEQADQILIGHPYNPPKIIPLVEVVPSPKTLPEIIHKALEHYSQLGKVPIALKKEIRGFVGNRLQDVLLREAYYLAEQGIVSPEDLDMIMKNSLGPRWAAFGVFETYHLGGGPGGISHMLENVGRGMLDMKYEEASFAPEDVQPIFESVEDTYGGPETYAYRIERRDEILTEVLETLSTLEKQYPLKENNH